VSKAGSSDAYSGAPRLTGAPGDLIFRLLSAATVLQSGRPYENITRMAWYTAFRVVDEVRDELQQSHVSDS